MDANSSGSHSHSHYRSPGSNRRNVYSSPLHSSSKRRRSERTYERPSDYSYPSKRSTELQNHRHSRERIADTYDLTSSTRILPSNRKRRAPHSPSPVRTSKRHSRSHSPRAFRSIASPVYYSTRSNRAKNDTSPRTNARSPTPQTRKLDINNKIPDTSLFAELVKDKHKRDKVLKEIIDKQEEKSVNSGCENSNSAITNNNNLVVIDTGMYLNISMAYIHKLHKLF